MSTPPVISSNIFLVGPMGVGKTTIGRQLATTLNMTFKDSDREIEERTGASIPLIFELEGEAGFRKREQTMITELTQMHQIILSTGGGVVLNEQNRRQLKNHGIVIYLSASVKELVERTAHSRHRPLLHSEDPQLRLEKLLQQRHPLYLAVADLTVDTGHRSIHQVVKAVLKQLKPYAQRLSN